MNTFWKVSPETGDLLLYHSGKDYWANVYLNKQDFPMSAEDVARHMNKAFQLGAEAKLSEFQAMLGIKNDKI